MYFVLGAGDRPAVNRGNLERRSSSTAGSAGDEEVGQAIEQTHELSDYREVDGVKVAFTVRIVNPLQSLTITAAKVEHNKPIDEAMFSRPVVR